VAGRWGPLQVRASGLLGLLQLKDRGQNPNELVGDVVPTVDMVPWWLRGERERLPEYNGVIAGADDSWQIFQPPGWVSPRTEWWWVEAISAEAVIDPASTNTNMYFRFMENEFVFGAPWLTSLGNQFGNADVPRAWLSMSGFWIPPDTRVELVHSLGAADVVGLSLTITRARV